MELFSVHISEQAIELVTETLHSGYVSAGQKVKEFEDALTDELGLLDPVTTNSGTSALVLALATAGVGRGDEVIIPPQTFIATGLAVLQVGAKPVFADVDPATGNISPKSILQKLTSKTRAIIPVHWGGYPCDLDEIDEIAEKHDLAVIEDAAHALGATYRGRKIGAISRFTCFSFQAVKHLTTVDGGCVCCTHEKDTQKARALRWFGIDRDHDKAGFLGEREYILYGVGYKFHMNDVAASIGLGNLRGFYARLYLRVANAQLYRREFRSVPGVSLSREDTDRTSAYWLFTMLVESRDDFIRAMRGRGVPASVAHMRIDKHPVFGPMDDLLGQQWFDARHVCLPVHEALTTEDLGTVIEAVKKGW